MSISKEVEEGLQDEELHQATEPENSKKSFLLEVLGTVGIPAAAIFITVILTAVQLIIADANRKQDIIFNDKNRQTDREIADKNRKQDLEIADKNRASDDQNANNILQHQMMSAYLKEMRELLLDKKLLEAREVGGEQTPEHKAVESVARAITLNTVRQLDAEHKGQLLKFLYETNLIGRCEIQNKKLEHCEEPIFELNGARLNGIKFESPVIPLARIDLEEAYLNNAQLPFLTLNKAEMKRADLTEANLSGAELTGAQMENAKMMHINLSTAILRRANLKGGILKNAVLTGADLVGADLSCANLQGANLDNAKVQDAIFKNARYDAKTVFPKNFDKKKNSVSLQDVKACYKKE